MQDTKRLFDAVRDVVASRDSEWADENVSLETAADTLAEALAEYAAQAGKPQGIREMLKRARDRLQWYATEGDDDDAELVAEIDALLASP